MINKIIFVVPCYNFHPIRFNIPNCHKPTKKLVPYYSISAFLLLYKRFSSSHATDTCHHHHHRVLHHHRIFLSNMLFARSHYNSIPHFMKKRGKMCNRRHSDARWLGNDVKFIKIIMLFFLFFCSLILLFYLVPYRNHQSLLVMEIFIFICSFTFSYGENSKNY